VSASDAPGVGHNSEIGAGGAEQLRAYVRRLERLEDEIADLQGDKREVYAEAKATGLCKKTLRKVIMRRRKAKNDIQEEDALLDLYEQALARADDAEKAEKDPLDL
jgi:uncharacterized protein (UPF0335 family)